MVLITQRTRKLWRVSGCCCHCPRSSKVQTGLGLSYYLTGNNKGAEAAFLKGVELDPSSPSAYGDLAEFYMAIGNLDQALTVYDKVVRIDPTDVGLHYKYAVALNRRNRNQEAADQLVQALASDANHAQSLSLLGRTPESRQLQEAVALLRGGGRCGEKRAEPVCAWAAGARRG
jgi:Flp pilus assembly protein TadD